MRRPLIPRTDLHQECAIRPLLPAGFPVDPCMSESHGRHVPPDPHQATPQPSPLTARHAACWWRRDHRRHCKPPAGLRRAQRNHASGFAPGFISPAAIHPSRPAIASPLRPSWHTPPSGACGSPLATVCRSEPPAPLQAPEQSQSVASKLHNEGLSAAWRQSGSRPDNLRYAKCRPSLRAPPAPAVGLRRLALRCSFPARPPASRPPPGGGSPKSGTDRAAICG